MVMHMTMATWVRGLPFRLWSALLTYLIRFWPRAGWEAMAHVKIAGPVCRETRVSLRHSPHDILIVAVSSNHHGWWYPGSTWTYPCASRDEAERQGDADLRAQGWICLDVDMSLTQRPIPYEIHNPWDPD